MTPVRTVLHLMRHGEVFNPAGVLYGRLPGYVLSELGQEMAQAVADYLAGYDVTSVVASPLERAQQTAEPIAQAHDLPVHTDERLIEADNIFEGKTFGVGDGVLTQPSVWRHLVNPFRPSWGEPYEVIATRMLGAIRDALVAAAGHESVLVSHQLPVWTVRNKLEGNRLWHDPRRRECSLASLTSLTYLDGELASVAYSEPAGALLAKAAKRAGA